MADATEIADLTGNVVTWVKDTYCPATLSNNSATTCGAGAGGFAFVLLAFLIIIAAPLIKGIATEVLKQRRIGLPAVLVVLVLAIWLPTSYGVLFALIPVTIWILFAQPLSQCQLQFRNRSLTLDIVIIILAPLIYCLAFGAQWGLNKLYPPYPAFLLLSDPGEDPSFYQDLKETIKKIHANLGDLIGNQPYELLPNSNDIDKADFFSKFAKNWNEANLFARNDADLRNRKIEFVRSKMQGNDTTVTLNAEILSSGAGGTVGLPIGPIQGVKKDNGRLMSLLLRISIIGHYSASINAGTGGGLSQAYITEFQTVGEHLLANVSPQIQDKIKRSGCPDLACVQSVATAFREALDNEYTAAKPALAQQQEDNAVSKFTQLNLDLSGKP
jgi:hypothetical protein